MTATIAAADAARRTQAQRREAAQRRLLDAALACLVEDGYAGFTTLAVARRAAMSQGGLFRHFPSKSDLLAATMGYLIDQHVEEWETRFLGLPPDQRTAEAGLQLLSWVTGDERIRAVFDLAAAARTDPQLRERLAPLMSSFMERTHALAHDILAQLMPVDSRFFNSAIDLALSAMLGLTLIEIADGDLERRGRVVKLLQSDLAARLARGAG